MRYSVTHFVFYPSDFHTIDEKMQSEKTGSGAGFPNESLKNLKFCCMHSLVEFIKKYDSSYLCRMNGNVKKEVPHYSCVNLVCECAGEYVRKGEGIRRGRSKKCGCKFILAMKVDKSSKTLQVDAGSSCFEHNDACQEYHKNKDKKVATGTGNEPKCNRCLSMTEHVTEKLTTSMEKLFEDSWDLPAVDNKILKNPVPKRNANVMVISSKSVDNSAEYQDVDGQGAVISSKSVDNSAEYQDVDGQGAVDSQENTVDLANSEKHALCDQSKLKGIERNADVMLTSAKSEDVMPNQDFSEYSFDNSAEHHGVFDSQGNTDHSENNLKSGNYSNTSSPLPAEAVKNAVPKKTELSGKAAKKDTLSELTTLKGRDHVVPDTPFLTENVSENFDAGKYAFDEDHASRGRKPNSKTKKTCGAPLKTQLKPYEERTDKEKALWLLKLWIGNEVLLNVLEGSYSVSKGEVLNWVSSGVPDTFLDDRVDFVVLSTLITYDGPGKGKSIFSTDVIRILTQKIKKIRENGFFSCLKCNQACDGKLGECDSCYRWYHKKCISLSKMTFKGGKSTWFCDICQEMTQA